MIPIPKRLSRLAVRAIILGVGVGRLNELGRHQATLALARWD
jgi:hypothetical protein